MKYTINDVMEEILFMKDDIKTLKSDVKDINSRIDSIVEFNELKEK